jgi:sigma-B regulation protein RsbQ
MSTLARNNVKVLGWGSKPMVFAHGFGCDQNMWRFVAPAFEDEYRTILFDHVGAGKSDLASYSREKYSSLDAYAGDMLEIFDELHLAPVIFVGHSVSSMIGILAAIRKPEAFDRLILVGPSPCYINDGGYRGGFARPDVEALLDVLDRNYLGWSSTMAPLIMGNPERPELSSELTESFCRTDPDIAANFARVTFLSDNRSDLPFVRTPSLILQCAEDVIAPGEVGEFLHRQLADSRLVLMKATGHCPNLSAPGETIDAIKQYLAAP